MRHDSSSDEESVFDESSDDSDGEFEFSDREFASDDDRPVEAQPDVGAGGDVPQQHRQPPNLQKWKRVTASNPFQPTIHPFSGQSGVTVDTSGFREVEYYRLFVTDEIFLYMVDQTNLYAAQYIESHPELEEKPRSRVHDWQDVTVNEMKKFLGITLLMGLIKKPSIQLFWSKDPLWHTPIFKRAMRRDRYIIILKFLHFADNGDAPDRVDPNRDRLFKVRPLLQMLAERFQAVYIPDESVAVDESILLWKGRLIFKQFIPTKRARFGIKSFALCESSGYMWKERVYTGAQDPAHDMDLTLPRDARDMLKTEKIVVHLMQERLNIGHKLYTDNFYTSVRLYTYLHDHGTNACGTLRKNRAPQVVRNEKIATGATSTFTNTQLICQKYQDKKKEVTMLSTMHGASTHEFRPRGRRRVVVLRPDSIADYNVNMGAVDKMDQVNTITPVILTVFQLLVLHIVMWFFLLMLLLSSFFRLSMSIDIFYVI